jgi:response regulator RpfG family c-di-GMP phosphodiesterase
LQIFPPGGRRMSECPHTILFVDDETNILHSVKRLLRKENYQILTASSGDEALKILETNSIHLVLADQRMPGMNGTELLALVKERHPEAIRIILSGYTDVDTIAESINKGHIYKFLLKPWEDQNLKLEIQKALDQYDLKQANRELHKKVLEQNEELKTINENLEALVIERTRDLSIQNQTLEFSRAILDDLPVAIIGVTPEGTIALINKEARKFSFAGKELAMGKEVGDYFVEPVEKMISASLESNATQIAEGYPVCGRPHAVYFTPLSGDFGGRGVILTLRAMSDSKVPPVHS